MFPIYILNPYKTKKNLLWGISLLLSEVKQHTNSKSIIPGSSTGFSVTEIAVVQPNQMDVILP